MISILNYKFRLNYSALLYLFLLPCLFLVGGSATQVLAEEDDFSWEMFIPAITGAGLTGDTDPPLKPVNPSPAHEATGQSTDTDLSWENGGGATSYDVYFGTNSSPDSNDYQGNQTATTYDPGTLDTYTTYYWRIDAKNAAGTTTGDVWQFLTSVPAGQTLCCILGTCSGPMGLQSCLKTGIPTPAQSCDPNPCNF